MTHWSGETARSTGLWGGGRAVLQRVVDGDEVFERERVVHGELARLGDPRDPSAGGDRRTVRELARLDRRYLTTCHWPHLQPRTPTCHVRRARRRRLPRSRPTGSVDGSTSPTACRPRGGAPCATRSTP